MATRSIWLLVCLWLLAGCDLVLGIVDLNGEDLEGGGGANGGAAAGAGPPVAGAGAGGLGAAGEGGQGGCGGACEDRVQWADGWGSAVDDSGLRIATAPTGAMVLVGEMGGPVLFDDTRTGGIFVLGIRADTSIAFSASFENCSGPSVAVGAGFRVIVAGSYSDAPSFDPSLTGTGTFVLSLNPLTGEVEDHVVFEGNVVPAAVATDDAGNIVVAGAFSGTATFATWGDRTSSGTGSDVFVAKLTSTLAAASGNWPRTAGGGGAFLSFATAATFAGTDDIIVIGKKAGTTVDFGSGPLPAGVGMFLARLSSTSGTAVFFLGARGDAVDYVSPGRVALGGFASDQPQFGSTSITTNDGFVASVRLVDLGNELQGVEWVQALQGVSGDPVMVAGGFDDDVFLATTFLSSVTVGETGPTIRGVGGKDILVGRLDGGAGQVDWALPFGGSTDDRPLGIEVSSAIALTGEYRGAFELGAFSLENEGLADIFAARLTP